MHVAYCYGISLVLTRVQVCVYMIYIYMREIDREMERERERERDRQRVSNSIPVDPGLFGDVFTPLCFHTKTM